MNKHTKIAIFVAPFLLLGGYIATDYYLENDAKKERVFKLEHEGHCDVFNKKCILTTGEMEISIEQHQENTVINATFPLDQALLFVVHQENNVDTYDMTMKQTPYYWSSTTHLDKELSKPNENKKLRVIVNYLGDQYIAQFYSQTTR